MGAEPIFTTQQLNFRRVDRMVYTPLQIQIREGDGQFSKAVGRDLVIHANLHKSLYLGLNWLKDAQILYSNNEEKSD